MKLTEVVIVNEAGEEGKIARADYIKHIVKELKVKPYTPEEEGASTTPADKVVGHILRSFEEGKDIDDGIKSEYTELVTTIEEDYNRSAKSKEDKKKEAEEAKAKKEAEKKAAEEAEKKKKEELAKTQGEFVTSVAAGADLAAKEFAEELTSLKDSLPEGASVVNINGNFGLEFAKDASKETIAQTLGYLMQKGANSEFVGNQIQFWIGDTIKTTVERGIYATAKEAAKHIAETLSKSSGKNIEAPSLDQYKRMAERTPVAYRNPKADPTAYLAISSAKVPKKGDKEKDDDYKKRLAAFEADREELQKKLAVGEVVKRKDILPHVNEMLIKHGLREAVDPNAEVISPSKEMAKFFHATFALNELLSVHKEGYIVYKDGENKIEVTQESMEEVRDAALANLTNIFYTSEKTGLKPADYIRGYVTKKAKVEVGKDADKKPIYEEQDVKNLVFPAPFFEVEKKEEASSSGEAAK